MRQVLFAREISYERAPLESYVIADGALQYRIAFLQRVEQSSNGVCFDLERDLTAPDSSQCSQMRREHHSNHASVWTSTERTAGRSCTIGAQLSPESADAYTCPPVVPKYTPHLSSESTAIASRSTFT